MVIEEPDIRHFAVKLVALAEKLLLMRSHFLTIEQIKNMVLDHNVTVSIEHDERFAAWIIVDKW